MIRPSADSKSERQNHTNIFAGARFETISVPSTSSNQIVAQYDVLIAGNLMASFKQPKDIEASKLDAVIGWFIRTLCFMLS